MDSAREADRTLQAHLELDPQLRAAAEWLLELRSTEISIERIGEWQQWLAADAGNRQAFERMESFWHLANKTVITHWPTDLEVVKDEYDGEGSVCEWRQSSPAGLRKFSHGRRYQLAFAAGTATIAAALGWTAFTYSPWIHQGVHETSKFTVGTAVGETRTLPLPDGSTVAIGGDSALTATFRSNSREVTLERGEAFFHVAKDSTRVFTVRAGRTAVTAIGTAFNVRRTGERVVVAVSEGSVQVATPQSRNLSSPMIIRAAQLQAGQQTSVEPATAALQVLPVDVNAVAGWRQGRLQYMNEPLELIVADLARYSKHNIRIADAVVGNLLVTGIVFEQNIEGWLASLESSFPLQVVRDASGAVTLKNGSH